MRYCRVLSNELMHSGIRGMHWGERNGPPYPLSAQKHRAVVKRYKVSEKKSQTQGIFGKWDWDDKLTTDFDDEYSPAIHLVRDDGTDIYPPVASVIRDFLDDGRPLSDIGLDRGKNGFDGVYDEVNPGYGEKGTTNNCPFVGAAVEMRSRGFNVIARRSNGGAGAGAFTRWFKGAQTEHCESFDEMKKEILEDGDGASGVLQGYYGGGLGSKQGGHTVHWHNDHGKIKIIDGQSHKEMDFDDMKDHYGFNDSNGCIRTRLDKCEPNWDELAKDGVLGANDERNSVNYNDTGWKREVSGGYDPNNKRNKWWWEQQHSGLFKSF